MNDKKYLPIIDNIKGFLIASVVFSHSLRTAGCAMSKWPYVLINIFSIPAFVFISGYCCKKDESLITILKNYIYPYIIWQTIYFVFFRYVLNIDIELQYFVPTHLLWYLFALIFWHLAVHLIKPPSIKAKILFLIASIILALLEGYFVIGEDYFEFSKTIVFFPYFLAGYYCKETDLFSKIRKRIKVLSHFLNMAFVTGTALFLEQINENWLLHNAAYELLDYGPGTRLLIMITGGIMGFTVCMVMPNKRVPFLTHWGKNTFPILVIHGLFTFWFRTTPAIQELMQSSIIIVFIVALIMTITFSTPPFVKIVQPLAKWPRYQKDKNSG